MSEPVRIFSNVAVAAAQDHVSDIVVADDNVALISFHFQWEGTPTGTFALFQSNLPQPGKNPTGKGWVPVPTAEVDFAGKNPTGAAGASLVNISATSGSKYIIVYSHAAGAGNLDCFQVSKAPGAAGETGLRGLQGPPGPSGLHGRYNIDLVLRTGPTDVLREQRFARYDTTATDIVTTLPPANEVPEGQSLIVSNEVGGNNVLVTPPGIDTIEGSATAYRVATGKIQEFFLDGESNWIRGFDLIKEVFFNAQEATRKGEHIGTNINSNGQDNLEFYVPVDFQSLVSLEVLIIPNGSEDPADIDLNSDYGTIGQNFANFSESDVTITFSLVVDTLTALDVSSVFSALAARHICGLELDNTGVSGGYLMLGILLRYK